MRSVYILLISILAVLPAFGQKTAGFRAFAYDVKELFPKTIDICLDPNGRIVNALPPEFKKEDSIIVHFQPSRLLFPNSLLSADLHKRYARFRALYTDSIGTGGDIKIEYIHNYFDKLLEAGELVTTCGEGDQYAHIREASSALTQSLLVKTQNPPYPNIISAYLSNFITNKDYCTAVNNYTRHVAPASCISQQCKCLRLAALADTLRKQELAIRDLIYQRNLLAGLFCCVKNSSDTSFPRLYDSMVKSGSVKPAFLDTPLSIHIKLYRGDDTSDFSLDSTSGYKSGICKVGTAMSADNFLHIKMVIENDWQTKIIEWHNSNIGILDRDELKKIALEIKTDRESMNNQMLDSFFYAQKEPSCSDIPRITRNRKILQKYSCYLDSASSIAKWMRKWLWYTGGRLTLNPLQISSPDMINTLTVKSDSDANQVRKYREYLALIEKNIENLSKKDPLFPRLEAYQKLRDEAGEKFGFADATNRRRKQLLADYTDFIAATTTQVHKIDLPVSLKGDKNFILFHDRARSYQRTITQAVNLPESYKESFGILNAQKEDNLTVDQQFKTFDDRGAFQSEFLTLSADLVKYATAFRALPVKDFLSSLFGTRAKEVDITSLGNKNFIPTPEQKIVRQADSVHSQKKSTRSNNCDTSNLKNIVDSLREEYWRFLLLENMLKEYEELPTPGRIELTKTDNFNLTTYTIDAKDSTVPYTNVYKILDEKKKNSRTRKFNVGKEHILTLTSGIYFNRNSAKQVFVDTAGQTFKTTNTDDAAKFVIGFQVHPFKSLSADGGIVPRFFLKRISAFLGFEITNPLNNIYTGLSYDVVPGITVNYGCHFYKYDMFKVSNGQVIDQTTRYKPSGSYFGVSVDPVVALSLLTIFFK